MHVRLHAPCVYFVFKLHHSFPLVCYCRLCLGHPAGITYKYILEVGASGGGAEDGVPTSSMVRIFNGLEAPRASKAWWGSFGWTPPS